MPSSQHISVHAMQLQPVPLTWSNAPAMQRPCQVLFCLVADGDSYGTLQYGLAALQGPRESMEDYATVVPRGRCGFLYAGRFAFDAAGAWETLLCTAYPRYWCIGWRLSCATLGRSYWCQVGRCLKLLSCWRSHAGARLRITKHFIYVLSRLQALWPWFCRAAAACPACGLGPVSCSCRQEASAWG